jgi:hypothetical protein
MFSAMKQRFRFVLCAIFAVSVMGLEAATAAGIPAPTCYRGWVRELREVIGDTQEADDFFLTIGRYNDVAVEGSADVLKYVGGDRFHEMFGTLTALRREGRNPFATDEQMFEVVAELARRATPGTNEVVGRLAANFPNAQGSLFELYVARRIASDGADYSRLVALQAERTAGASGVVRRYDAEDAFGKLYENKSWTRGLPDPSDPEYVEYLKQFQADVIIHAPTNFRSYGLNTHASVSPDLERLKDDLLSQFGSKLVIDNLSEAEIAAARSAFLDRWTEGAIVNLFSF